MQIVPVPAARPMFLEIRGDAPLRRATGPPIFVIATERDEDVVTVPAAVEVIARSPRTDGHGYQPQRGRIVDEFV